MGTIEPAEVHQIARAFNFGESMSVPGGSSGRYDARTFIPSMELLFADQPIVGTTALLSEHFAEGASELVLNVGVGPIAVFFDFEG